MSFRDNLQHLRDTRNMTQSELAMLVGVSRQSVAKWEAEKSYPEMDKLLKLCDLFECTLDDLVRGDLTGRAPDPIAMIDTIRVNIGKQVDLVHLVTFDALTGRGDTVFTLNLDHLVKLERDPAFRNAYDRATYVSADGAPVVDSCHRTGAAGGRHRLCPVRRNQGAQRRGLDPRQRAQLSVGPLAIQPRTRARPARLCRAGDRGDFTAEGSIHRGDRVVHFIILCRVWLKLSNARASRSR